MKSDAEIYDQANEDYEWAFSLNRYSLQTIGVWPEYQKNKYFSDDLLVIGILVIIIFLIGPQMYAMSMVFDELPLLIDNVFQSVVVMTSTTKLILLWMNKKQLSSVLSSIKYDYFKWKDDWERRIMLNIAKRGRFITICGYALMLSAVTSAAYGPIFGITLRIINNITDRGGRRLPIQAFYPFDYWEFPYYQLTFMHQIMVSSLCGISLTSPVTFFSSIVFHSCGQITILGSKISKLLEFNDGGNLLSRYNRDIHRRLKEIVDSHTRTIRILDSIENSFKTLILAQIIGLTVMLCCLGFQLVNAMNKNVDSPPTSQLIILTMALLTILMHTFAYCFVGESLALFCEEMYCKIYETQWYSWHSKYSQALILIMIRSQEPIHLTAGKFLNLNLRSFSGILKSTAGYISMLIAVRDK